MNEANEMYEIRRNIEVFSIDYIDTAYHLRRYLNALDDSERGKQVNIQAELQDAVLNLNNMRADMNVLFNLLQSRLKS
jgi:hypothetical protein